ncbi:MAG: BadF/BadG/BcrA/BcrD ATPase family protein [Dehalococcoidia bacterium]
MTIDQNGKTVYFDSEKITTGPGAAVKSLVDRLSERFNIDEIQGVGVSGTGKSIIPEYLNWAEYSSSLAIATGTLHLYPDAKTILQIGGQSSLVIVLEDGLKKPWKVNSNPLCAAGTGRFMEQQAYRLGISMSDFADLALKCTEALRELQHGAAFLPKQTLSTFNKRALPPMRCCMLFARALHEWSPR